MHHRVIKLTITSEKLENGLEVQYYLGGGLSKGYFDGCLNGWAPFAGAKNLCFLGDFKPADRLSPEQALKRAIDLIFCWSYMQPRLKELTELPEDGELQRIDPAFDLNLNPTRPEELYKEVVEDLKIQVHQYLEEET